jgi:hypothetical protein
MPARVVWKVARFEVLMPFTGNDDMYVDAELVIGDSVRLMTGDTSYSRGRFLSSSLALYAYDMPDSVAAIS